jgi:hypothetical protein
MDSYDDRNKLSTEDKLYAQRSIIRDALDEIANDIGMVMRDAGLHFPVFMTVRDNGDSLATIATPLDPSDDDWERSSAIVCEIIGKKIGGKRLGAGNCAAPSRTRRR